MIDFGAIEPWQYAAAFAAAALVGLSKTGVAGVGVLMVPLLALAFPARQSTGILLPILVAGDLFALAVYRRHAQWQHVRRCMVWALIGIVAGWLFYKWGDPSDGSVKQVIGGVVMAMLILGWQVARRRAAPAPAPVSPVAGGSGEPARPPEPLASADESGTPAPYWFVVLIGLAGGFTTMVANAAGPVWIVYMLALGLPKQAFLGTSAWAFFALNLIKVPFSWSLGLIHADSLGFNLVMLPALLAGAALGLLVLRKLPQVWFNRIAGVLAVVAALNLLFGDWVKELLSPSHL